MAYNTTPEEESRFINFVKYGITIDCAGGVCFHDDIVRVIYSKDPSSGDLEVIWK